MANGTVFDRLVEMKGRLSAGLSTDDRRFIEENYRPVTGRAFTPTTCTTCYKDRFIEMYNMLRKQQKNLTLNT